mmetsp:Transcript_22269/g.63128  ORF Transcript_22269/g.63128 Transcript_22269/m.63128 type:complete len:808 (+) Transcript_22269:193-2616(+)
MKFRACIAAAASAMCLLLPTAAADNPELLAEVLQTLNSDFAESVMNQYILVSKQPGGSWEQSSVYRWADMMQAYQFMVEQGLGGQYFLLGDSVQEAFANVALFLAQSFSETIQYNMCDENNYSSGGGLPAYPVSAACGQMGQDYSKYTCHLTEWYMECPEDPSMAVRARTMAGWAGAPPPLFCAPRSMTGDALPRWDYSKQCGPAGYAEIPEFPADYLQAMDDGIDSANCNAYGGQYQGSFTYEGCGAEGCANADQVYTAGGTVHRDVEGCCWWGRGIIQTTGRCNVGKLNYYLTGTYYDGDGRAQKESNGDFPYRDLNLCEDPGLICNGPQEFKWLSGMLFWLFDVQPYSNVAAYNFDFQQALERDGRAIFENPPSGRDFVDRTSGLVNRGCPATFCPGAGAVHALDNRFNNFLSAMDALRHVADPDKYDKPPGVPAPPYLGPWYSKPVLCAACEESGNGFCGLKWSSGGAATCVSWASTPEACAASGGAATAWCKEEDTLPPSPAPVVPPTLAPTAPQPTETPTKEPTHRPTSSPTDPAPTEVPTRRNGDNGDDNMCAITVNRDECEELMKHHSGFIQQEQQRQRMLQSDLDDGDNNEELCSCWNFCGTAAEGCNSPGEKRLLKCAAHALVAGCTMDDATPAPTPPLPTCQVQIGIEECNILVKENPRQIDPLDDPDCQCRSFCDGQEIMPCCRFDDAACVLECDGDLVSGCPVYHDLDSSDESVDEDALDRIWNGNCALEVDLSECPRLMNGDEEAAELQSEVCPCAHFCNGKFSHCCQYGEYCEPECINGWFVGGCDVSVFED